MAIAALLILPTLFAPYTKSLWLAVAIVSVAAAAHQWWSCNLFTTVSDMFPRRAVGSVVGIGGFVGAMSAMGFQRLTGYILDASGSDYRIIFVICAVVYVGALLLFHLLVPAMEQAPVEGRLDP
jgi:ACS family hexuronate transporter-like MFS transporter